MEATREIDPLTMPQGLSLRETEWWVEMASRVVSARTEATGLHAEAIRCQVMAERARRDYDRLRSEYRARHHRKPRWAVDMTFQSLAVAQDCMVDDAWFSRQASEQFAGTNAAFARQAALLNEMAAFLAHRTAQRVPAQRAAS